ncbi:MULTISPECIES: hypothetical protein [unclassified Nostoc]|uniref:hypothetical protein n=1 Tax=unclassified Nostoc TaxID=2593658 RepID=UPI002AD29D6B|nr:MULTISPECIES: hypothetical protein [unclassified Nostoc]MDZ8122368.1 hypothetical protein [Nostoc sp. CmiVER01]MDZ8227204.1 hypothetical protein [Nostoc sp. ChiVER01]
MPKPLLNPVSDGKQRRTNILKKQSTLVQYGVNKHTLRVTLLRRYRYANTSRLRRETLPQRWFTISNGARSSQYNYA